MTSTEVFQHITGNALNDQLNNNEEVVVVDIRDANAFSQARIKGAIHLTNDNLADFMRDADLDVPTIVCCYHGISSQQAAQFLISQDFSQVYSLDGGFEQWRNLFPEKIES